MQEKSVETQSYGDLRKILKDEQVHGFFIQQLQQIPPNIYTLDVAFEKIFILIEPHKQNIHSKTHQHESKYVIKISKGFPLQQSLRIHLLEAHFQPRVSDSRDLFHAIMGKDYDFTTQFKDIVEQLVKFDEKLHALNEDFLSLQKVGTFHLGQTYFYHELAEMYSSVAILKDHSLKKSNTYVGITETHILIFKEIVDKTQKPSLSPRKHHHSLIVQNPKQLQIQAQVTQHKLRLVSYGDIQCVQSLHYNQSQKVIRMVIKKFKKIKNYHEEEQIKRQYKFIKPEIVIRGILKYIAKFQPCEIQFQPCFAQPQLKKKSSSSEKWRQEQPISQLIAAAGRVQQQLKQQLSVGDQKSKISIINKLYQKIIEYYSARANPYYLIFVNKLNHIYHTYYISNQIK